MMRARSSQSKKASEEDKEATILKRAPIGANSHDECSTAVQCLCSIARYFALRPGIKYYLNFA